MPTLLLIRHGQTEWNLEGRYTGQSDIPLNDTGREQARVCATKLANSDISAFYSSHLIRAVETAEIIAEPHGLEVVRDPRLQEINQGVWEGRLFNELRGEFAKEFELRKTEPNSVRAPGGETVGEVQERVLAAVGDIVERHSGGSEQIVIAAHGLALALVRVHFENRAMHTVWDYIPPNAEVVELVV